MTPQLRDATPAMPGTDDGAGGCLPGTVVDVSASAQPGGEVAVGATVNLVGAAQAITWRKDCSRTVHEIRTGTWSLTMQVPCGGMTDVTNLLSSTSGLTTTFVPRTEGIYIAAFEAKFGVDFGSAQAVITAARRPVSVGPNVQVTFDSNPNNDRSESSLAVNPLNASNMVGSSKKFTDPATYSFLLAAYATFDGGASWTEAAPLQLPPGAAGTSDPAVAWDNAGGAYIAALPVGPGQETTLGIAIYRSPDGGRTWGPPRPIHHSAHTGENQGDDKQNAVGDTNPGSPFYGNVYVAWDDIGPRAFDLRFARTTDHGTTWTGTGAEQPGSSLAGDSFSPAMAVAPDDGTLYIAWASTNRTQIKLVKSTDGGNSFSAPDGSAVIADGITDLEAAHLPAPDGFPELPGGTFRVDTFPTICAGPAGVVCVAWADYREGVSRIYFQRSFDAGATWTADHSPSGRPLLVGAVAPARELHDFHPQLAANTSGDIMCAFYEYGPMPTQNLINVVAAVSDDNAGCFFHRVTVTDRPWDPAVDAPLSQGKKTTTFIGDYFGFAASDLGFFAFWTDTRTGIQEIFTSRLSVGHPSPLATHVAPGLASVGDSFMLFATSSDGRIFANRCVLGQNFQGWIEMEGGGRTDAGPTAAAIGTYMFVAIKGLDGHVYLNQGELGQPFIGWGRIDGIDTDVAPGLASVGDSFMLFATSSDGRIFANRCVLGQNFQGWIEMEGGGRTDAGPTAAAIGTYMFVAIKGLDGHVYLNQGELGQPFIGWGRIDGIDTDVAPGLASVGDSFMLFATSSDGRIFANRCVLGQNFQGWIEMEGGGRTDAGPTAAAIGTYMFVAIKELDEGPNRPGHVYLNQGELGQPFIGWGRID